MAEVPVSLPIPNFVEWIKPAAAMPYAQMLAAMSGRPSQKMVVNAGTVQTILGDNLMGAVRQILVHQAGKR